MSDEMMCSLPLTPEQRIAAAELKVIEAAVRNVRDNKHQRAVFLKSKRSHLKSLYLWCLDQKNHTEADSEAYGSYAELILAVEELEKCTT